MLSPHFRNHSSNTEWRCLQDSTYSRHAMHNQFLIFEESFSLHLASLGDYPSHQEMHWCKSDLSAFYEELRVKGIVGCLKKSSINKARVFALFFSIFCLNNSFNYVKCLYPVPYCFYGTSLLPALVSYTLIQFLILQK